MITLTSLLVSLAAAPVPLAPPDAELVTYVPRLDAIAQVLPFARKAGERTVLLRPSTWRDLAYPLLQVDVTDAASMKQVGLDATGPLTVWSRDRMEVSCTRLSDEKAFLAAAEARLTRLGTPFTKTFSGVKVLGATDPLDRVLGAVALKGGVACAASGRGVSLKPQLEALAKLVGKPPPPAAGWKLAAKLPGVIVGYGGEGKRLGAVSVSARDDTATLDGAFLNLPVAKLSGPGPSPFANAQPAGLATLKLRLKPDGIAAQLDAMTRGMPGGRTLGPAAQALAPSLTGNVMLHVRAVEVRGSLATQEARFFAFKFALVAETKDAATAAAAVEALNPESLSFRAGKLEATAKDAFVCLSSDTAARDAALASIGAAKPQAHAAVLTVNPALLARALGQVPLMEVVQHPELAGVVAASTEVGPLLLASESINAWLDPAPGGQHRAQLTWTLAKPQAATPKP